MIRTLGLPYATEMAALHARSISPGWPESDMHLHLEKDICLGFGDPLCGFIILRHVADQSEVLTIVTDPDKRRRGIGKALLSAGEKAVRGAGSDIVFLEVAEDNESAITLYKSAGFSAFGRRPAYYRREKGRVAAINFRKRLDALTSPR